MSVFNTHFFSYTFVFIGLGILALGLHHSLQGMTARDCDRGVVVACKSLGRQRANQEVSTNFVQR